MGFVTGTIFAGVLVVGVTVGSPFILGFAGLSAAGPVAGGMFAAAQATGGAVAAGSWMAAAQSVAMAYASPTP